MIRPTDEEVEQAIKGGHLNYAEGLKALQTQADREAAIFKGVYQTGETDLQYFQRRQKELGLKP